jgi:uncharacterized coiled-coil DUF342 family protein
MLFMLHHSLELCYIFSAYSINHTLGGMHLHMMTLSKIIHQQKTLIQTLDTIIAAKREACSSLEQTIKKRKEDTDNVEKKRKRVKFSERVNDLVSVLEEVSESINCNELGAQDIEDCFDGLKNEIDSLKGMMHL